MKTYPYSLRAFGERRICIGRQGENLATRIDVDVTPWKTEYPTGTISLFVVPPVGNGYLAALEENGNTIRWAIRDTDTAYDGHGKAELILKDASGVVVKSVTAYTICAKSPSADEPADPPEAIRPWIEQILDVIQSVDVSADAAAASAQDAEASAKVATDCAAETVSAAQVARASAESASASEQAAQKSAAESERYARLSEQQALTHGSMYCYIDETGRLHYVRSDNLDDLNLQLKDGRLRMSYGV